MFRKRSKSNLSIINFDNIDVRDVKYLPPFFDGDVLFILPPINMSVPSMYELSMDSIYKMCGRHPWCICKAQTNIVIICIAMEVSTSAPNEFDRLLTHFLWECCPKISRLECKVYRFTPV